jgi:hypothetical protein
MTDQPTPQPASAENKPKREPIKPVSLLQFLRDKTIATSKQLAAARRMPPPPLSFTEITEAVELVRVSFDALLRLESLLAELSNSSSEVASQVIQVAEAWLATCRSPSPAPLLLDSSLGVEGVWALVREVHAGGREPEEQKRRQVGVRFVLWIARLKGALGEQAFMELATRAFPPAGRSKSGKPEPLDLGKLLASQLHRKSNRETLLRVTAHFQGQLAAVTETVHARDGEVERQQAEIVGLQSEVARLNDELSKLRQQLAESEARITALGQDITDHRAVKRQSEKQLRARMSGVLNDQLLPLMRDIHDSASMEPVRAHVILDRTDSALNLIKKEATWLTSSD